VGCGVLVGVGVGGIGVAVGGTTVGVAVGGLGAWPQAVTKSRVRPKAMTTVSQPNLRIIVHLLV